MSEKLKWYELGILIVSMISISILIFFSLTSDTSVKKYSGNFTCELMIHNSSDNIKCVACYDVGGCSYPYGEENEWSEFSRPQSIVGIPYNCMKNNNSCELIS